MANREWHGRHGRDMDDERWGRGDEWMGNERDPEERWMGRGDEPWARERWRGDERWMGRGEEPVGRDRWRTEEPWGRERSMGRDERWRRDLGRDFSRHEWSPYDRAFSDEQRGDFRESGFGFGGTDRGFRGGGYGGYGGGGYGGYGGYGAGGYGGYGAGGYRERRRGGMQRPMGRAPRGYQRSDERIKEDLCDLLMSSWIDAENVEIEVRQGEITLSGTVEDRRDKRAIEDMAEHILGVKDVQNRIRVGQPHETQPTQPQTRKPSA